MSILKDSKQPASVNATECVLDVSVPGSKHGIETWRDKVGAVQTFLGGDPSSPTLGADPHGLPRCE